MSDPGPIIDLEVNAMEPDALARSLVTRALRDGPLDWADIACDIGRYSQQGDLALLLVGQVAECVSAIAADRGVSASDLWRGVLLTEAVDGRGVDPL